MVREKDRLEQYIRQRGLSEHLSVQFSLIMNKGRKKKMALRTIRVMGDEILTKQCRPVKEMTPRIKTLIEDMLETMYDAEGVGLAAPQLVF